MTEKDDDLDPIRNSRARQTALAAVEALAIRPTGVVQYQSRGRVLVVGGEQAQWFAARIEPPLHAEVLLLEGAEEPGVPCIPLGGRALRIVGHLGAFELTLGEHGRHNHQVLTADLVVDFGNEALIQRELLPPGYWHFGCEPQDLDAALLAVNGMVGTFEKPRYFNYDPSVCAHARSGQAGCSRCIDACPAEAIISIGEQIEVNPNLCQGGGICASVCPSGAMRYAYPGPGDTAERVRLMLMSYREAGGRSPVVMFAAESDAAGLPPSPPHVLLVAVEELASVGHEIWLAALAWGAERVLLAEGGSDPGKSSAALEQQCNWIRGMLRGMGYDEEALRRINVDQTLEEFSVIRGLPQATTFAASDRKRQLAGMAMDHLWEHSRNRSAHIGLEADAPYGQILVDQERCTLCMACTSVCPALALSAGDESPRLVFHESNCVQCGICANACPEKAISLEARFVGDPQQRRQGRVLYEDPPFCCVACGKPFATRRVIDNILEKLDGHAMFRSDRAKRRLQMCEDCRVVDAVQDTDAMQAGLTEPTPPSPKTT